MDEFKHPPLTKRASDLRFCSDPQTIWSFFDKTPEGGWNHP